METKSTLKSNYGGGGPKSMISVESKGSKVNRPQTGSHQRSQRNGLLTQTSFNK
jgi:hypothetical protein